MAGNKIDGSAGVTHAALVALARSWLKKGHSVVLTEMAGGIEHPDAIGFTAGFSTLVECKVSRADFHADKNKMFRAYAKGGMGQFRYYLAPAGLLSPEEMPPSWGLLEVNAEGKVRCKRKAEPQESNAQRERSMLVSTLRRVAKVQPEGVDVRFYPIVLATTTTIGIDPSADEEAQAPPPEPEGGRT